MNSKNSAVRNGLISGFGVFIVLGAFLLVGFTMLGRTQGAVTTGNKDQQPASENEEIVHTQDFGIWNYSAVKGQFDPLRAGVDYRHETVDDLLAYVAANKEMAATLANNGAGGRVEVAITFVYPVEEDWYRQFAREYGFQAVNTQVRVGAPGTGEGTMNIGGTAEDPLPKENIDKVAMGFFSNSIGGIFGAWGTIDTTQLDRIAAETQVFLVDVTPAWVRADLVRAGFSETLEKAPHVDSPFGYMERFGLQNFTSLPLPTEPPVPVGTAVPTAVEK